MAIPVKQSTAQTVVVWMADSTDGKTGKTGLTLTVTLMKYGESSFSTITPSPNPPTDLGGGHYAVGLTTTHTNTVGLLSLRCTGTGADPADCPNIIDVVAYDKTAVTNMGLSAMPAVATGSAGAIPTTGAGANQIAVSGTGHVGLNWANVNAPTTVVGLSGTTIKDTTDVETTLSAISTQISGLGTAGGAAILTDAATDNSAGGISGVTSGTTKVGTFTSTYASTSALDGTYHILTGTATALDVVYQFLAGSFISPINAVWTGYLTSTNDTATIQAWNHVGGAWETIGAIAGQAGTTNIVKNLVLYPRHAGTSVAELGKVYIRITETGGSNPVLNTDQIYVSYVAVGSDALILETISNIATTGAALNTTAASRTITTGTESGAYTATTQEDGSYHDLIDSAGTLDAYYEFDVSATSGAVGVGFQWQGYVVGIVNTVKVYARNWGGSSYEQIGTIVGQGGTANMTAEWALTTAHTSAGLARLRFAATGLSSCTVRTDRTLFGYTVVAPTVTAIQSGLALSTQVDALEGDTATLTGRLSALRAGYLDNLSAGAVAQASATTDIQSRLPAALVSGRIDASVGAMAANVLTAAATAADFGVEIAAAVWGFAHETARTAKGVLVRLDAWMTGKATGQIGSTAAYYRADGTTKAIEATQNTALGTRVQASTVDGD